MCATLEQITNALIRAIDRMTPEERAELRQKILEDIYREATDEAIRKGVVN